MQMLYPHYIVICATSSHTTHPVHIHYVVKGCDFVMFIFANPKQWVMEYTGVVISVVSVARF